jgi:hypothetical protein
MSQEFKTKMMSHFLHFNIHFIHLDYFSKYFINFKVSQVLALLTETLFIECAF